MDGGERGRQGGVPHQQGFIASRKIDWSSSGSRRRSSGKAEGQALAETDLKVLLATMEPVLFPEPYGFAVRTGGLPEGVFATVAEEEGLSVVAPLSDLGGGEPWALISLSVHSDLAAVGLTAAFAAALAGRGISCNVIAGVHHDHLFVPWDRRFEAVSALRELSDA